MKRRRFRRLPRRAAAAAAKPAARPRSRNGSAVAVQLSVNAWRTVVCGAAFVLLVTLKLLLPGGLASLRGTLGAWLARDTDFVSAFSAVGHAVSGEGGVLDSLGDAYVAVFGGGEAAEVAKPVELETDASPAREAEAAAAPEDTRDYPEHAAAEQRVLGFDFAPPLSGTVTSGFGWRVHPDTGREAFHYGVDVAAEEGAAVACFADGTVGVVAEGVELGKYLTVHHENGVTTLYGHCSRITVSPGAKVARGDKLAEVGATGNATGPHLHFEIQDGEDYLDPAYYLS